MQIIIIDVVFIEMIFFQAEQVMALVAKVLPHRRNRWTYLEVLRYLDRVCETKEMHEQACVHVF